MIAISQVFNHLTIAPLFDRTLLAHCLFMFSDVSLRVILFPKNSKLVQMHNINKVLNILSSKKRPKKKDNQTITRLVNSKQWLKIKASGKFMERTLEEGLWNRGGCSLLFTEKSPTSRCVFCWLLQFSWGRNHAVSPSCRIPMTCNWRRCAEMHQHSIRDGFLFRWLICIAY